MSEAITSAGKPIQSAYLFNMSIHVVEAAFDREKTNPAKMTKNKGSTVFRARKKWAIVLVVFLEKNQFNK
jgi:hypothetical protein